MRKIVERIPAMAALAAGLAFSVSRLAGPDGLSAASIAWAAGAAGAGIALGGLLTALDRRGDAPRNLPAPAAGGDPLPSMLSAFQAYADLELWDLACERAREIVRYFPDRAEVGPVKRRMAEIQWKLETRPASSGTARPGAQPGRPLPELFAAVKTYIDLEAWPLALDKAQEIIRHYPDSDEAQRLSRSIEVLKGKASGRRAAGAAATRADQP